MGIPIATREIPAGDGWMNKVVGRIPEVLGLLEGLGVRLTKTDVWLFVSEILFKGHWKK